MRPFLALMLKLLATPGSDNVNGCGKSSVASLVTVLGTDPQVLARRNAAQALGKSTNVEAIPALTKALRTDSDPGVRYDAAWALGQCAVPLGAGAALKEAIGALTNALPDRGDSHQAQLFEVGAQASLALAIIGGPALPTLIGILKNKDNPGSLGALRSLYYFDQRDLPRKKAGQELIGILLGHLNTVDTLRKRYIIHFLGRMGPEADSAFGAVKDLLADPKPEVRLLAAEVLYHIRPQNPFTLPTLVCSLKTGNTETRILALEHLHHLGDAARKAIPALIQALSDSDPGAQILAMSLLNLLGSSAQSAIPKLKELAASKNPAVAQAAAEAVRSIMEDNVALPPGIGPE
jgi:HEAT repeat protein